MSRSVLLLIAGLVPGLFIALALMVYNHFYACGYGVRSRRRSTGGIWSQPASRDPADDDAGDPDGGNSRRLLHADRSRGDRGALHVLLGASVYRALPLSDLPGIFIEIARTIGNILFIAATAKLAAWVFTYDGLPIKVAAMLGRIDIAARRS